ncbi:MAG: uroporphyrinogen-III synthase [Burkholderiales bacterium]|nr:uroporphyrinogen-III synthase [Burkholderiales bacterium]
MQQAAVIITRPAAQAGEFARKVQAIGRRAELFPLLEIHALTDYAGLDSQLARLHDYALVAFVSPNAIDAVFSRIPCWPRQLPIAVMGAGSRTALAAHGIDDSNAKIISPSNTERTDSETLLDELDLAALRDKKVLIVRGETGRELLADALRERGIEVVQLAAYRRAAPTFDDRRRRQLRDFLERENDWVVTSSEALRTLLEWAGDLQLEGGVAKMQRQHLIVPHTRIAETAKTLGFPFITLTGSGDEHVLVALQSRL